MSNPITPEILKLVAPDVEKLKAAESGFQTGYAGYIVVAFGRPPKGYKEGWARGNDQRQKDIQEGIQVPIATC